jgi:transposase InsO family protein
VRRSRSVSRWRCRRSRRYWPGSGLGKLSRLEPPESPNRYERRHPGELLHVDVKKLGRIPTGRAGHRIHGQRQLQRSPRKDGNKTVGWEFVHVCVDDATRLACVEVLSDEKATTAVAFLYRAIAFYRRHGITVERVMSDNGACYRSTIHAFACRALGLRHLRTRPYRPRTNGKAERFIGTLLAGWAHGAIYGSAKNAPQPLTAGSGPTTIAAHTAPSATSPRSPASTS